MYHPQSNGLVEHHNRTIKNFLVKLFENNPSKWPYIINGILFAHGVSLYSSTKYSPFIMMYNRQPLLPIYMKYNADKNESCKVNREAFDSTTFDAVFSSATKVTALIIDNGSENI